MKTLLDTLNYQPNHLTKEELESPACSIAQFFDHHPLHASREKLAKLYEGWLYNHALDPDPIDLCDMTYFFSSLVEMVNLSYVIAHHYDNENRDLKVGVG